MIDINLPGRDGFAVAASLAAVCPRARIVLTSANVAHVSAELLRECAAIAFVPTALAEPMLSSQWPNKTTLRFLLTGADTLHRYPAAGLPFQLVNNYGPTECAVVATSGIVKPTADHQKPAIGRSEQRWSPGTGHARSA